MKSSSYNCIHSSTLSCIQEYDRVELENINKKIKVREFQQLFEKLSYTDTTCLNRQQLFRQIVLTDDH